MLLEWIGYCLLVSALFGVAAFAAERALGHYGRPVRAPWVAAIVASLAVPALAFLVPEWFRAASPVMSADAPVIAFAPVGPVVADAVPAASARTDWNALLSWVWGLSAVSLALYLGVTYRRLRREMRGWAPGQILDSPVMMSRDRGPAVVGIRRSIIVMPRWIAELEEHLLRLVFLHEQEHQRAGDHRLYQLGMLALILMPWNVALWWQVWRLRLAIEFDCDRRVLRRGADPRDYAEALLVVGSRSSSPLVAAAAFAERRSAVERRLRRLTKPMSRFRGARSTVAAGVGAVALVAACASPTPPSPIDEEDVSAVLAPTADADEETALTSGAIVEAFVVIDGEIQPEGPVDLGGLEIDAVEILKGEAATERYGERGADGVILITTKEAPDDSSEGKIETFSASPVVDIGGPDEAPLIVVDGKVQPPEATLSDLGALDIDHVEVVKGEAARQLYGEQARNGAVRITTKVEAARSPDTVRPDGPSAVSEGAVRPDMAAILMDPDENVLGFMNEDRTVRLHRSDPAGPGRPLVIVDGVMQLDDYDVGRLHANDIERVEILSGSVALAAHGDRARNGAIRVTMKGDAPPPELDLPPADAAPPPAVEPDRSIRPTTQEARNPVENLPPPPAGGQAADRPSFIPYDTPPQLTNGPDVMQALNDFYPTQLRDAGIGGRVELWMFVDSDGTVQRHQIKTSSGNEELDAAAGRVVESMRFSPAANRGQPTPVWVSQWVTFQVM